MTGFWIAAANAQDRETIAAAQREGSVTIYAGFPNAALHALMPASFRAKYGIRVDLLSLRSSELNERIRTEQAAGRFLGDVLLQGENDPADAHDRLADHGRDVLSADARDRGLELVDEEVRQIGRAHV